MSYTGHIPQKPKRQCQCSVCQLFRGLPEWVYLATGSFNVVLLVSCLLTGRPLTDWPVLALLYCVHGWMAHLTVGTDGTK